MIHGLPVKLTVLITLVGPVVANMAQGLLDKKIKNLKIWFCKTYKINDPTFSDWIIPVDTGICDADQAKLVILRIYLSIDFVIEVIKVILSYLQNVSS